MARAQAKRWWEAHPGAVIALALALAGGWLVEVRRNAEVAARFGLMLERRDREFDSLERRLTRVEDKVLERHGDGSR